MGSGSELEVQGVGDVAVGEIPQASKSFASAAVNIPGMENVMNPKEPIAIRTAENKQEAGACRISSKRDIQHEIQGVEENLQQIPKTGIFAEVFDAGCKLTENVMEATKDLDIGLPEPEIQIAEVEHTMDPKPAPVAPAYTYSSLSGGPGGH